MKTRKEIYDDYQLAALKTLIVSENTFWYVLAGVVGETGEFLERLYNWRFKVELEHEAGDAFWYYAVISHLIGYSFSEVFVNIPFEVADQDKIALGMYQNVTKIAELLKKDIRQGLTPKQKCDIIVIISDLTRGMVSLIGLNGLSSVEEIFDGNVKKLADRKNRNVLKGQGDNR